MKDFKIYSMSTDVYIYIWKRVFESLVIYSKVKKINRRYVTHYTTKLTLEIRAIVV